MNGSRVNPNAKKDFFQDYDIVYIVNDIESFTSDHSWVLHYFDFNIKFHSPIKKISSPKS
jgi:aminoglycoside 6-adenylyltransferase